jgi:polyisoprenoid-binding protein YceI
MLKHILFFVFFIFSLSSFSQEWNQNKKQTKALFSIKKLGIEVVGNFSDAEVQTNFHINDLTNSYVKVKIRVKSISMGTKSRNKKILDRKYFCEEDYKFIHFTSSKIIKNGKGDLYLAGLLKIKGITKEVQIPIKVLEHEKEIKIRSNFKIRREDFKLGEKELGLSQSAKIVLEFTGTTRT